MHQPELKVALELSVFSANAGAEDGAGDTPGRTTRRSSKKGSGANMLFVKGAPERVLERCTHVRLSDGSTVTFSAADPDGK